MKAKLVLEDKRVFIGESFGYDGETTGEVVFNTSMSGYQEIITDPSYTGQIITMTYPQIGNYGINEKDIESNGPSIKALIVKEVSGVASNYRSNMSLDEYLKKHKIIGLSNIDTRALVRHIREKGAMRGIISTVEMDESVLIKKVEQSESMVGADLVKEVTTKESYSWSQSTLDNTVFDNTYLVKAGVKKPLKIVAYDFGAKYNILRMLVDQGADLTVVPASTPAEEVLKMNPDGIFLSNGPGDPAAVTYAIENIKKIVEKDVPVFGICLGHQLLCLACGATSYKLKFGHRGANQPVKDLTTGKIEISSQNHGFSVDEDSLKNTDLEITHVNLNDNTIEGVQHKSKPIFSVQYHPEASPGPHDSAYLFTRFFENILKSK